MLYSYRANLPSAFLHLYQPAGWMQPLMAARSGNQVAVCIGLPTLLTLFSLMRRLQRCTRTLLRRPPRYFLTLTQQRTPPPPPIPKALDVYQSVSQQEQTHTKYPTSHQQAQTYSHSSTSAVSPHPTSANDPCFVTTYVSFLPNRSREPEQGPSYNKAPSPPTITEIGATMNNLGVLSEVAHRRTNRKGWQNRQSGHTGSQAPKRIRDGSLGVTERKSKMNGVAQIRGAIGSRQVNRT